MSQASYEELLKEFRASLEDVSSPEGRRRLAERLAGLAFDIRLVQDFQTTLLAALRARDVVVRDQARGLPPSTRQISFDPRDSFEGASGLKRLEWDGEAPYRWTGPGHDAVIRVWLDRSVPVVGEIAVYSYGDPRNRQSVQMFVDGAKVTLAECENDLLRSEPFPIADDSLYTEMRIHVPWLSADASASGPASRTSARRSKSDKAAGHREQTREASGSQGIAFTHLRFFAAT